MYMHITFHCNASFTGLSSLSLNNATSIKMAANRWKTIAYGRLKRAPKLPVKPVSSESSSSATDDLSEDSSSVEDDDDDEEEEEGHAGLEYALDTKNLSIEIKVSRDQGNKGFGVNKSASSADLAGMNYLNPGGADFSGLRSGRSSPSTGAKAKKAVDESKENPWMKWDNDRTTRSNQDNQRELETSAMRDIVRHLSQVKVNWTRVKTHYYSRQDKRRRGVDLE